MAFFQQTRSVQLVPGAAEAFVIQSFMLSANIPTELPHLNVFVIAVADPTDPTQDTLARVAGIADLSLIPIGRDPGIAAPGPNGIEFLSQAATVSYPDIQTANTAATTFVDRVSALVSAWILFDTEFYAPTATPATYTLPIVDASQSQALINAYAAAKQAGYLQQQTSTSANTALTAAQADYVYKSSLLTGIATVVTSATKVQTEFGTTVTQFGILYNAGQTFYAANTGGPGAATFLTALNTAAAQQGAMPGYLSDAIAAVTASTAYQTARMNDVTASATALTGAQNTQITQAQALTAANALTAAALAAVLAVCPDFVPSSVPYVPG